MKRFKVERSGLRSNVALATGCAAVFLLVASASQGQDNLPQVGAGSPTVTTAAPTVTHIPVAFRDGHETDPRDRGRPVVLVAGALGVTSEVFREAFSHVHPATAGQGPSQEQAQQNKAALMDALGKYGITNDRLDEVSNYYRYVRSRGEHWPATPAEAYAVVEKGIITAYVVTSGGSGYSSPPTVSVPGFPAASVKVQITFAKDFRKNGAVTAITTASTDPAK